MWGSWTRRWMPCKSRRRAAKRRSIRGHMPSPGGTAGGAADGTGALRYLVLQQEVASPLFEGRACCETDAGCVFYDDGAGGGNPLLDGSASRRWRCRVRALGGGTPA